MGEVQKKTLGIAISSLVFGCLVILPLAGLLFALTAVILGILAVSKISKDRDKLKGKGLAISGIVLGAIGLTIVPLIYMLAAIAIPQYVQTVRRVQENAAKAHLEQIALQAALFNIENGFFPNSIDDFRDLEDFDIDVIIDDTKEKGYELDISKTYDDSTFLATLTPDKDSPSSAKSFCITEDREIRYDPDGKMITTYNGCLIRRSADTTSYY